MIPNPNPPFTPAFIPNPNFSVQRLRIPDVSKWTYNLVGMYEKGGLTLRLAYNHRSGFAEGDLAERDNFFTLQGRGHGVSRLDWSSSYAVTDKFTVFFDWTNILGDPFRSDIPRVNIPAATRALRRFSDARPQRGIGDAGGVRFGSRRCSFPGKLGEESVRLLAQAQSDLRLAVLPEQGRDVR